eukprot:1279781-Pyramimonas_sp.AAC.1
MCIRDRLWCVRRRSHVVALQNHDEFHVRHAHRAQQEVTEALVANRELSGLLHPVAEDVEPGEE